MQLREETTFNKKDISRVLESFVRIIKRTLKKGEKVTLTGFGSFSISRRPARKAINLEFKTPGIGNSVFDIEGRVDIIGLGDSDTNRIEMLLLHVNITGGPISYQFPAEPFIFPLRDFNGTIYNRASFFITGRMNLFSATLAHTDANHIVNQKNDCTSEPTYVGGDSFFIQHLTNGSSRPKIAFYSSFV